MAAVTLITADRQWIKSSQGMMVKETPRNLSFCTHTIKRREPMIVTDATVHSLFASNPAVVGAPHIRSYLGIPLTSPDGYNIGALCAVDIKTRRFDENQIEIMTNFAALVMDAMELRLIAQKDFLTGILTRRAFIEQMDQAWSRYARQLEPAAVILFDIDHFKSINDMFGHAAGDAVLEAVARCCADETRSGDAFGRIGGEEFAILLANVSSIEAASVTEHFRNAIAKLKIPSLPDLQVTASFGIASLSTDVTSIDAWLGLADVAMYAAKRSGRNRSCAAEANLIRPL